MSKTKNFPTRAAVLRHLQATGWQIGTTMFYQHCDQGKLARSADGTYSAEAVTTYASTFCRRLATGKKMVSGLAQQREEVALQRAKVALQRERRELERLESRAVPIDEAKMMVVGRAVCMIACLKHLAVVEAPGLVRLMDGNPAKAPALVAELQAGFEKHVVSYAEDLLRAIEARSGAAPDEAQP